MQTIQCRIATKEDAAEIARVHDASRRNAYRAILSEPQLSALTVEERSSYWREQILISDQKDMRIIVAEQERIRGFISVAARRGSNSAEIDRIYVEPEYARNGAGRALINYAFDYLRDYGFEKAVLWTFDENNPARRFYEAIGFTTDGAQRKCSEVPKEIRYAIKIAPW